MKLATMLTGLLLLSCINDAAASPPKVRRKPNIEMFNTIKEEQRPNYQPGKMTISADCVAPEKIVEARQRKRRPRPSPLFEDPDDPNRQTCMVQVRRQYCRNQGGLPFPDCYWQNDTAVGEWDSKTKRCKVNYWGRTYYLREGESITMHWPW